MVPYVYEFHVLYRCMLHSMQNGMSCPLPDAKGWCHAGVQFTGHSSQVTALCWLPMAHSGRNSSTGSLMASCDATGSLHIWSAVTGVGKVSFRESSGSSSNGPGRRQTAADQVSAPTGGQLCYVRLACIEIQTCCWLRECDIRIMQVRCAC